MAEYRRPEIIEKQRPTVTPDSVTALYSLRTALWGANDVESIIAISQQAGIPAMVTDGIPNISELRKAYLNRFINDHYPQAATIEEHKGNLDRQIAELTHHLATTDSQTTAFVFGSYGNGIIRSKQSDLDILAILPHCQSEEQIQAELAKLKALSQRGFVFSEELSPFTTLEPVMRNGNGLTRLYGMTSQGIEVEFHILGINDFKHLYSMWPGEVKRVAPVAPKNEARVSFTGIKKDLPKPGDRVRHFMRDGDDVYKGFFSDNVPISAQLLYDPFGEGQRQQQIGFRALVKGFLYHNHLYQHTPNGFTIDLSRLDFKDFLSTFYYSHTQSYSTEKLTELEHRFWYMIGDISMRYQMPLVGNNDNIAVALSSGF